MSSDRAVIFVDGNNWYHALRERGVTNLAALDYGRVSSKLVMGREWTGTRYYVGRMNRGHNPRSYAQQRSYLSRLRRQDPRISVHLGRLERRTRTNPTATELLQFLANLTVRIDTGVYKDLVALGHRHRQTETLVEKAVDVMLAVDMVVMAERDEYDVAYVLSGDGDFTPAVKAVKARGKRVYAASASYGAQLARVVDTFIPLDSAWFDDCYLA